MWRESRWDGGLVVDHRNAARCTAKLKAPIDAAKMAEAFGDFVGRDFKLAGDRHGRRRIKHVVAAGDVQLKRTERARRSVDQKARKSRSAGRRFAGWQELEAVVGFRQFTVSEDAPADSRQNALEQRVVNASGNRAVNGTRSMNSRNARSTSAMSR